MALVQAERSAGGEYAHVDLRRELGRAPDEFLGGVGQHPIAPEAQTARIEGAPVDGDRDAGAQPRERDGRLARAEVTWA